MKIDDIQGKKITGRKPVKKKSTSETSFFAVLDGQLHPTEETASVQQTSQIETEQQVIPAKLRMKGVSLSEETIELLESYGDALGNLDLQAEDLQPLIEALENDRMALMDIKAQLPEEDPLALLIDHVATITYLEAEKFRRGDYSD